MQIREIPATICILIFLIDTDSHLEVAGKKKNSLKTLFYQMICRSLVFMFISTVTILPEIPL